MFSFTKAIHYEAIKGLLFKLDPELAHQLTLKCMAKIPPFLLKNENLSRFELTVAGLNWATPFGLAAGLDKDAEAVSFLARLPFGAIEVGTVTPKAQSGNPKPRLWRYPQEEGLRNQMGFNNGGADEMVQALKKANLSHKILGINFGKNKDTPAQKAGDDYAILYQKLASMADYVVINVSSPNTPGLRDLQSEEGLRQILEAMKSERAKLTRPLFIKVAPDLSLEGLDAVVRIADDYEVSGLIATNTTHIPSYGAGGVSGGPLKEKARLVREHLLASMKGSKLELIGVGGLSSLADIWDYWRAGGRAVQLYTGFIYGGPPFLYHMIAELNEIMERHSLRDLEDLLENIHELPLPLAR